MSKSLGNIMVLSDAIQQAPAEAVRYVLLSAHYRAPLDWNDSILQSAKNSLDRLYGSLRMLADVTVPFDLDDQIPQAFQEALMDDLNTPRALAELFALSKQVHRTQDPQQRIALKAAILQSGDMLGLLQQDPEVWLAGDKSDVDAAEIDQLIAERKIAKDKKDWARADEIRDILSSKNIVVEDSEDGTRWRIES
jgi:cysteinyl-tRNA synthetase